MPGGMLADPVLVFMVRLKQGYTLLQEHWLKI